MSLSIQIRELLLWMLFICHGSVSWLIFSYLFVLYLKYKRNSAHGISGSTLANTNMVAKTKESANSPSSSDTQDQDNTNPSKQSRSNTPTLSPPGANHLPLVWQSLKNQGLSTTAANIITKSWLPLQHTEITLKNTLLPTVDRLDITDRCGQVGNNWSLDILELNYSRWTYRPYRRVPSSLSPDWDLWDHVKNLGQRMNPENVHKPQIPRRYRLTHLLYSMRRTVLPPRGKGLKIFLKPAFIFVQIQREEGRS